MYFETSRLWSGTRLTIHFPIAGFKLWGHMHQECPASEVLHATLQPSPPLHLTIHTIRLVQATLAFLSRIYILLLCSTLPVFSPFLLFLLLLMTLLSLLLPCCATSMHVAVIRAQIGVKCSSVCGLICNTVLNSSRSSVWSSVRHFLIWGWREGWEKIGPITRRWQLEILWAVAL